MLIGYTYVFRQSQFMLITFRESIENVFISTQSSPISNQTCQKLVGKLDTGLGIILFIVKKNTVRNLLPTTSSALT